MNILKKKYVELFQTGQGAALDPPLVLGVKCYFFLLFFFLGGGVK
jgi:hypothetical protein